MRHWALLLNQTAVMTNASYLADELAAVAPEVKRRMRERMAAFMPRVAFSLEGASNATARGDIFDTVVAHMLARRRGAPAQAEPLPPNFGVVAACADCSSSLAVATGEASLLQQ